MSTAGSAVAFTAAISGPAPGRVPVSPDHRGGRCCHRYGHRHELWPDLRLLWRQGVDMVMQRFLGVVTASPPGHRYAAAAGAAARHGHHHLCLMLTEWVGMSRIARAGMLKLKDQGICAGLPHAGCRQLLHHLQEVLPNIIGPSSRRSCSASPPPSLPKHSCPLWVWASRCPSVRWVL